MKTTHDIKWRLEGPFDSSYSLALLNREIARALSNRGVDVALHSTEGPGDFAPSALFLDRNPDLAGMNLRATREAPDDGDVTSRNLYPPRVTGMASKINLMHSYAWEESSFPSGWAKDFNSYLQGLTCLSDHVLKVMQDSGVKLPMAVSGCGVDHWNRVTSSGVDLLTPHHAKKFKFLHVSSCFPRKGPNALLEAYGLKFSADDDVTLVIKTFPNPHNEVHELLAGHRRRNAAYPHVVLLETDLSDADLKSLYESCDVLVAPSCAEGFGLPMAEAMLSGLPVITTAWSGQLDFCNTENSWLVDFSFEQARTHFNLLPSAWAAIDVHALGEAMGKAYGTEKAERERMANLGKKLLDEKFTWDLVASRLISFYEQLNKSDRTPPISLGWISTWNVKCGIASYSEHLLNGMYLDVKILAAKDSKILTQDTEACHRSWTITDTEDLSELADRIDLLELTTLVIQFNFGFFNHESLFNFVKSQKAARRTLIIDLHATIDPPQAPTKKMSNYIPALAICDRILVHSIADMNRMKALGLESNLTLFPLGILEIGEPYPVEVPRIPLIATYGFCLPHKGLPEVLDAVAHLRDEGKTVRLNMVNAEYPVDFSASLSAELRARIVELNLQSQATIESRFLSDKESLSLLQEADLIIFAYHATSESASGAVRYGLACGRPTLVTDLPIFHELGDTVWRINSHDPKILAARIWEILNEIANNSEIAKRHTERAKMWRDQHRYSSLSTRLCGLIESLSTNIARPTARLRKVP